ncbi:amphi-Trp domain-containing protein [Streptomyces graminilatus]|uniref:amphi-Trp domain-containing protein n=1 Tax=Streptomyces graminilatus TaxID=1464070 RepID=UPI0006E2C7EC|nr:amphi-Trp domain-containing protein [Streptomyces graminilatus]
MKDLKFEQKRALSRLEAADQLAALAAALREGGEAELELGAGTLSLRIPDDLRSEVEIEIDDGEVELEIEFKWPTASAGKASTRKAPELTVAGTEKATKKTATKATTKATTKAATRKSVPPAKPGRGSTSTAKAKGSKRPTRKTR